MLWPALLLAAIVVLIAFAWAARVYIERIDERLGDVEPPEEERVSA
jgi:hypothetical protein